jgi:HAD superfamily hydrolase (TIGR01509 family)
MEEAEEIGAPGHMVKAIFWDNDGVLVDTERLYFLATKNILLSAGINLTKELYAELLLVQAKGAFVLAEQKGYSPEQIEDLRFRRNALYQKYLRETPLVINGVVETLEVLSPEYIMGIVTTSTREHFDSIHKKAGLLDYFDFFITIDDVEHCKPHPEPYEKALALAGVAKEECVAIEDSQRGLASALGAGLQCVIVPNEMTRGGDFAGAYRIVNSVREIPGVIEAII